jgi:hypothetical protein
MMQMLFLTTVDVAGVRLNEKCGLSFVGQDWKCLFRSTCERLHKLHRSHRGKNTRRKQGLLVKASLEILTKIPLATPKSIRNNFKNNADRTHRAEGRA